MSATLHAAYDRCHHATMESRGEKSIGKSKKSFVAKSLDFQVFRQNPRGTGMFDRTLGIAFPLNFVLCRSHTVQSGRPIAVSLE